MQLPLLNVGGPLQLYLFFIILEIDFEDETASFSKKNKRNTGIQTDSDCFIFIMIKNDQKWDDFCY